MPITQQRMLTLINAALDYRRALDRIETIIRREHDSTLIKQQDAPKALSYILLNCTANHQLEHPIDSEKAVIFEAEHFRRYSRINATAAKRKEVQRRKAGIQPRAQALTLQLEARATEEPRLPSFKDFQGLSEDTKADILAYIEEDARQQARKEGRATRPDSSILPQEDPSSSDSDPDPDFDPEPSDLVGILPDSEDPSEDPQ